MKLDFHTHGKLAKRLPFSTVYTDWLLGEAKKAGLDAICLTEHFNTLQFDELYGYLLSISSREGDTLCMKNGLRVFPGMETDLAEGGHILSLGPVEAILELNQRLAPHKTPGKFLPFAELMDLFAKYPVVVGGAHPFREGGHIPELPGAQLQRLDFLDLNGKDVAENRDRAQTLTQTLGKQLGKPVVSGSDTHQAVQYGCICTEFERDVHTVSALHEEMKAGRYRIIVSDHASFQVHTAGMLKRALKEIHALGGDYVDVLVGDTKEKDAPSFQDRIAVTHHAVWVEDAFDAQQLAKRVEETANDMAWKGYTLVSVSACGEGNALLLFRKKML